MSAGYHRGTSSGQDQRFTNKEKKLLSSQKFPKELNVSVDMSKVKLSVMKPWISKRVTELLGVEDDVLINFIFSQLEEKDVNPKKMQINLTGFMEKNTSLFMKELWRLVISASKNPQGIPDEILEEQKAMHEKQVEAQKRVQEEIAKRLGENITSREAGMTDAPEPAPTPAPAPAPSRRRPRWDQENEANERGGRGNHKSREDMSSSKRPKQEEDEPHQTNRRDSRERSRSGAGSRDRDAKYPRRDRDYDERYSRRDRRDYSRESNRR